MLDCSYTVIAVLIMLHICTGGRRILNVNEVD